jgi:ABC-type branched-subunit amino acid transport system substrate-binding protein
MPSLLNRRRSLTALVVAGIAVGGLAATAQSQSTKRGATPGFTLKIGDTVPFTGDNGAYGPSFKVAADLAVAQAQAALKKNGITNINVSVDTVDDATKSDTAVAAARKLISDGASCLAGSIPSANTIAIAQAAAIPSGVAMIATASSSVVVSTLDDQGLLFRVFPSDALQGPVLAAVIQQNVGKGKLVSLAARNDVFGVGLMNQLKPALTKLGMKVQGPLFFDPNASSYDSEANQIVANNPDAFVVVEFPAQYAKIGASLLRTGNFDAHKLWLAGGQLAQIPSFIPLASMDGGRGTRAAVPLGAGAAEAYDNLFKANAGTVQRQGVDAFNFDANMLCFLGAVAAHSSDGRAIAKQLQRVSGPPGIKYNYLQLPQAIAALQAGKDIDYEGVTGSLDFDANGDPSAATFDFYQYINATLTVQKQYRLVQGRARVLDLTPPTTPRSVGPHVVKAGKPFVLTIHSTDPGNVSPPIRFTCTIDSPKARACTATLRLKLKKGNHRIGVRATDDQDNVSVIRAYSIRAR